MSREKIFIFVGAAVLAAAFLFLPPYLTKRAAVNILHSFGFSAIDIGSADKESGHAVFSMISLDPSKFSTIDNLVIEQGMIGIKSVSIDNLVLTAEMSGWNFPEISGWHWPKLVKPLTIEMIELKNGQLDILTAVGALRVTTKAQATLQNSGDYKISAIVTGEQNQLTIDTRWDSVVHPPGNGWMTSVDIRQGRLNLDNFSTSRISGWLNIDQPGHTPLPLFSGQISAGHVRFGKNTALVNATVTIENSGDNHHIILQGDITPYDDMRLTADISNVPDAPGISAMIETKSLPDLITFITHLQEDISAVIGSDNVLTSLLITPGNLARVEKEIRRAARYDSLQLTITGSMHDLIGKIIARRESQGSMQRHVISLDPG